MPRIRKKTKQTVVEEEPETLEPVVEEPAVVEEKPVRKLAVKTKKKDKTKKDKPDKPKRKPSAYALFIKDNYDSVRDLPPKDRFKELANQWKAQKSAKLVS
jgi:hypothetical protein